MAAAVALPGNEFFSESYMDAFYKAHVASSRTRGSGNLDEDIAAIEAEIRKVQRYRSKFRSYRFDRHQQQLNSCGNSECSDEEEVEDASPTSVFKVYNSSCSSVDGGLSPHNAHKSPDIFTWAAAQQVQHDHNYCCELSTEDTNSIAIDHGTININNIRWQDLDPATRAHTIQKLSCILQQKPSGRQSPTFSSLDWLPNSLTNWIRKTGTRSLLQGCKDNTHTIQLAPTTHPCIKLARSMKTNLRHKALKLKLDGIQSLASASASNSSPVLPTTSSRAITSTRPVSRNRRKASPYCKLTRQLNIEVTRVRNMSSCSEGEDSVVID